MNQLQQVTNAANVLKDNGFTPLTDSDICFSNVLGTVSKESGDKRLYRAIAVMMVDNDINPSGNLEEMIISFEDMKEIALSTDILYTDMAMAVHSHSFKSEPFKSLKVIRLHA